MTVTTGTITLLTSDKFTWSNVKLNSLVKTGNLVEITLDANLKATEAGSTPGGTVYATLPKGFRPAATISPICDNTSTTYRYLNFDTNGNISTDSSWDSSMSRSVRICGFYIAAS